MEHRINEKTLNVLIDEICSKNKYLHYHLLRDFEATYSFHCDIKLESISDVRKTSGIKKLPRLKKIALIWKAMEIHSGHKIRNAQILALLIMSEPKPVQSSQGRLSEIGTGEGKTIIIAMLAVLFGLENQKVDVGM